MAEQVLMLALSPTMEEGTIVKWNKSEGDAVAQSELLCEVETDKATMEYESNSEGTLLKILVPAGGQAKIGDPIAIVGKEGEDISALVQAGAEAAAGAEAGQTAQAPAAPAAPAGPRGKRDEATPSPGEKAGADRPAAAPAASAARAAAEAGAVKASPLARRMAAEAGVDLGSVRGTGPGGRVVKRDLDKLGREAAPGAAPAAAKAPAAPAPPLGSAAAFQMPSPAQPLQDRRIPVSGKRKIIAQRLSESMFSAPHYYLRVDVAVDSLLEARERLNERLASSGKVSLNAFLLKFAAEALKRHPAVNSSWEGDTIFQRGSIDIALAVAQEDGLITPLVRDCGSKGILAIDRELSALIEKARANRLAPEEYTGAGFTISSLGSAGILEFTAIINPPGSAILAVGGIRKTPVVDEQDQVRVQSTMILTLSCDHRVIDGAVGAAFLADLKRILEHPIEALY